MTLKKQEIKCYEIVSRKWHAKHPQHNVIGIGGCANDAVRNLRKEVRKKREKDLQDIYQPRFTYGMGEGS